MLNNDTKPFKTRRRSLPLPPLAPPLPPTFYLNPPRLCFFDSLGHVGELLGHVGEILGHVEANLRPLGRQISKNELIGRTLIWAGIYNTL